MYEPLLFLPGGGSIHLTMNAEAKTLHSSVPLHSHIYLQLFLMAFAVLSLVLTVTALLRSLRVARSLRTGSLHWKSLSLFSKFRLFGGWPALSIAAAVAILVGAAVEWIDGATGHFPTSWVALTQALGAFLLLISTYRYFTFYNHSLVLILTLRNAFPLLLRNLIGVMPLLLGFVLIAVELFGQCCEEFATFAQAWRGLHVQRLPHSNSLEHGNRPLKPCSNS